MTATLFLAVRPPTCFIKAGVRRWFEAYHRLFVRLDHEASGGENVDNSFGEPEKSECDSYKPESHTKGSHTPTGLEAIHDLKAAIPFSSTLYDKLQSSNNQATDGKLRACEDRTLLY